MNSRQKWKEGEEGAEVSGMNPSLTASAMLLLCRMLRRIAGRRSNSFSQPRRGEPRGIRGRHGPAAVVAAAAASSP